MLYVGGRLVMAGTVTVGAFVAFGVYLAMLVWPMIALGWAVNLVQRGAASMGRINQLFRARARDHRSRGDRWHAAAGPRRPRGRVPGVWFPYPGARDRGGCCEDVSFRVEPGRSLAIVGATGSGKSTLVDLLVRAYDPDAGAVLSTAWTSGACRSAELRRAIGFVPQETFLFSETLRDNVLLGAPDDGRLERVADVGPAHRGPPGPAATATTRCWASAASTCPAGRSSGGDRAGAGAGPAGVRARRRA